jgi:mRNA interferase HigB
VDLERSEAAAAWLELRIKKSYFLIPTWERGIIVRVRIISRRTIREFWHRHPDTEQALRSWFYDGRRAVWKSPADIKRTYANASIIGGNRVVFNIKGNRYRLVVAINYDYQICYIRFLGSHVEYEQIGAERV